jgi:hypothetical protein
VQLQGLSDVKPGDVLAPAGFSARAIVTTPPTEADPETVTVDRTLDLREADVIGPLAAYAETSRPQSIQSIASHVLTLSAPIDGLAPGDIVGPASVSAELNHLRVDSIVNLQPGDELQVTGLESSFLLPVSGEMTIAGIDAARGVLTLTPSASLSGVNLRPESLKVAAVFNPNFVSSFALFAQQQDLYLCWLGCQTESENPAECPGVLPDPDPCGSGG